LHPVLQPENPANAISRAQTDFQAGRVMEALAEAKAADAMSGKPPALALKIHQMIVSLAVFVKDYPLALTQIEKMIAAGEGDQRVLQNEREQVNHMEQLRRSREPR
jgi:hypothetical protein